MKKLTLTTVSMLIIFSIYSQNTNNSWIYGNWAGTGFQVNTKWEVVFNYNGNTNEAVISYPTLSCSGKWILESESNNTIIFKEKITAGKKIVSTTAR